MLQPITKNASLGVAYVPCYIKQSHNDYEIIVIKMGYRQNAYALELFCDPNIQLKWSTMKKPWFPASLNRGIREAARSIVVDSDDL